MHRFVAALFAATMLVPVAQAQANDAAALFGVREHVEDISLSPDGRRVAFIAPDQARGSILYTAEVAAEAAPVRAAYSDGDPERLRGCGWVSNTRLVCSVTSMTDQAGLKIGFSRLIGVDADGKNLKLVSARTGSRALGLNQDGGEVLDWLPDEDGAILRTREFVPEYSTGTHLAQKEAGLGVERVDTMSLASKRVEPPKDDAADYISDGHGRIRIMSSLPKNDSTGYLKATLKYFYRTKDSDNWREFGKRDISTGEGFNPVAVDRNLDAVYGFRDKDGRRAVFRVALDGTMREELVYAHPEVDVDGLVRIGRQHRVVGVTFATDKRQTVFFDPALKSLGAALSKALPGLPLVSFIDSSLDESRLLLWAGSDTDPGRYYVFDKKAKSLNEVLLARPQLESVKLATVKPVNYKAADGTMIPGYLTLPAGSTGKNLPTIVMPHGGPSARDEWGFDWLAQYYANRGYAVLQPNFRGSSGYGDQWFQKNGFQSWRTAIGDVNDGGRWLVSEGIADPGKLAIVGWSYGGYASLQSAVLDPDLFKAIVAIAPVTDLERLRQEARQYTNFKLVDASIGNGPHVKEGSPAQNAGKIKAPVLMFHGDLDANVDVAESRLMADRLTAAGKKHELVVYPKLEHSLADSKVRTEMLGKSDAFLRASLGIN
ncbi:S9 family peptidase [Sphingomonas sp. LaA6.9]|uniref:alpha/beta hydrolase family protein n=1 Tax=Sphingomonas sp. LaA6.9 TaxID=2919914 RepID=UPI001F4F403F|nr:S9 family peptidase [Sphingomonas sp. LaA6.9]MCJ8157420.1 S9 family peptidase [Sphingomonas sp. LaA6.9]